jgi:hypothetical protein
MQFAVIYVHEFCCNGYKALHCVTWSSGILLSAVVTKCLAGSWHLLSGAHSVRWTCPCMSMYITSGYAKNMDITGVNLLHKMWCNRLYDGTAPPRSNLPTRWRQWVAYYRHKNIQCSKFKTQFSSKTPFLNDKRTWILSIYLLRFVSLDIFVWAPETFLCT